MMEIFLGKLVLMNDDLQSSLFQNTIDLQDRHGLRNSLHLPRQLAGAEQVVQFPSIL
jgi:hypothetical protein